MSAKLKPNDVIVTFEMVIRGVDADDASDWVENHVGTDLFAMEEYGVIPDEVVVPLDFKTAEYVWNRRATRRKGRKIGAVIKREEYIKPNGCIDDGLYDGK